MSVFAQGKLKLYDAPGPPALNVAVELELPDGHAVVDHLGDPVNASDHTPFEELEARDVRELADALTDWLERVGR